MNAVLHNKAAEIETITLHTSHNKESVCRMIVAACLQCMTINCQDSNPSCTHVFVLTSKQGLHKHGSLLSNTLQHVLGFHKVATTFAGLHTWFALSIARFAMLSCEPTCFIRLPLQQTAWWKACCWPTAACMARQEEDEEDYTWGSLLGPHASPKQTRGVLSMLPDTLRAEAASNNSPLQSGPSAIHMHQSASPQPSSSHDIEDNMKTFF
jgi:hypothetical protein